jgi:vacuolar-type H+-ATPase subunit E/Vma4
LNPANGWLLTWIKQVAFIKQEAMEKAREIKVKADEEFAIEKVRPW